MDPGDAEVAGAGSDVIIVGGGPAGLSLGYALGKLAPSHSLLVIEKMDTVGGKARSRIEDGFVFEHGPSGLLCAPGIDTLIDELDLAERARRVSLSAFLDVCLAHKGRLIKVPGSPGQSLTTGLLSARAKTRMLLEPLFAHRTVPYDETIIEFATRHFGREFAERVARNTVLGLMAADAADISVESAFPALRTLERAAPGKRGRALLPRAAREAMRGRRSGARLPEVISFAPGGVGVLFQAMAASLGRSVISATPVTTVREGIRRRYRVECSDGRYYEADTVVLATPASDAAGIIGELVPHAVSPLRDIPYAGVRIVGLGYRESDLDGFPDGVGFLVPRGLGTCSFAVAAVSRVFPDHAPPGHVLLHLYMGGSQDAEILKVPEAECRAIAQRDLFDWTRVSASPVFHAESVVPFGIPQYTRNHSDRIRSVTAALASRPGIFVAGNAYHAVSLTETIIDSSERLAPEVIQSAESARKCGTAASALGRNMYG